MHVRYARPTGRFVQLSMCLFVYYSRMFSYRRHTCAHSRLMVPWVHAHRTTIATEHEIIGGGRPGSKECSSSFSGRCSPSGRVCANAARGVRRDGPVLYVHLMPMALVCVAGRVVVEGGDLHVAAKNGDLTDAKARPATIGPGASPTTAGCVQRLLTGRVDVKGLDSDG